MLKDIYKKIDNELKIAKEKHPNYPIDMFKQLTIMQEESGEVSKALLDYHSGKDNIENVEIELLQTAAMCVRMLESLPKS